MKIRNVAVIIFYDKDNRILLQDRRGISKLDEEWGFFGGEIKKDETPEEAVVRETKEELSFDLKEYKYVLEYSYEIEESLKKKFANFDFDAVLCKVFIASLKDNLSKFKLKEGKNMQLFSLNEAEKLKFPSEGDIEVIRRLKKILS
jgi:mutator protein MutT